MLQLPDVCKSVHMNVHNVQKCAYECTQTHISVHKSAQTKTIGNRCALSMCLSFQVCTSMHA